MKWVLERENGGSQGWVDNLMVIVKEEELGFMLYKTMQPWP